MASREASKTRLRLLAGAVAALSILATCVAIEIALRVYQSDLLAWRSATSATRMVGGRYPAAWDPGLGYAPAPGSRGVDNPWRKLVTIDADGLRSHASAPAAGPVVLAVGDSFVFGDEVDDADTWPAALERRIGRPVRNGGVFGYGLDQIVLRAEALLTRHPVETLVVSVIPDDVSRCEYSYRFAHKPWFDLEESALRLHNVPAPRPRDPLPGDTPGWRLLQRSALLEFVLQRLDPLGRPILGAVREHRNGGAVSAALVDRLARGADEGEHALRIVLAWHPGARMERLAPVRDAAAEHGIPLLELEPELRRHIEAHGGSWSLLFHPLQRGNTAQPGHMTPLGNSLVADAIASWL